MAFNPRIRKLTEELFPIVGKYLEEQKRKGTEKVKLMDLSNYLATLGIKDLPFIKSYPYSYQVDLVIDNLVRTARVHEDGDLIWLSDYGRTRLSG